MNHHTIFAPAALFLALLSLCVPFFRPSALTQSEVDSRRAQYEQAQQRLSALTAELESARQALDAQQAEQKAQQALTDEAKQAYLQAAAELDALARRQSGKYTGPALHCSLDFRDPLDGGYFISCLYGEADYRGVAHHGVDLAAGGGTPVYAVADGIVSAAAAMRGYGNCVQVSHGADDGGSTYDTLYAHLQSICVAEGQAVAKGDLIGYVGNTGDVVGANGGYHLHLELRVNDGRTDPQSYIPI